MSTRSAHYSITGLQYQFDKSILEILNAPESERTHLEGIEDIDLSQEYIQCKYHSTQKYTRSTIREPIVQFLKHFVSSNRDKVYTLYAHFKDFSSFKVIDIPEIKAILADELSTLNLNDNELLFFLSNNFRFHHGKPYTLQLADVIISSDKTLFFIYCRDGGCGSR
jgi:hypothetical protein